MDTELVGPALPGGPILAGERAARNTARSPSIHGVSVGSFVIDRLLGCGRTGATYLAKHALLDTPAAVKFFRPALAAQPALLRRMFAEARAANLAAHGQVVRVMELEEHAVHGRYVLMDFASGETLSARLRQGPAPLEELESVVLQLCAILADAHARGLTHRNLAPECVRISRQPGGLEVKLMDFGVAVLREGGALPPAPLNYLAPEQRERRRVDARADLYALGAIAFELATGLPPPEEIDQPLSPRMLRPELPAAWEAAILRVLSARPEDRFADADAFADALRGTQRSKGAVDVELLLEGAAPVSARAYHLSHQGALLSSSAPLPPLFSQVSVQLGGSGEPLQLQAEVVRHIDGDAARGWGLSPAFAVQFLGDTEPLRQRLAGPPPPPSEPPDPYEVLNAPHDATRAELLDASNRRLSELALRRARASTAEEERDLDAAKQAVAWATRTLCLLEERLRHDARRGNAAGVARCLAAGCAPELVEREHALFAQERPGVAARVEELLECAREARAASRPAAAHAALRLALTLDPLNLAVHALLAPGRPTSH